MSSTLPAIYLVLKASHSWWSTVLHSSPKRPSILSSFLKALSVRPIQRKLLQQLQMIPLSGGSGRPHHCSNLAHTHGCSCAHNHGHSHLHINLVAVITALLISRPGRYSASAIHIAVSSAVTCYDLLSCHKEHHSVGRLYAQHTVYDNNSNKDVFLLHNRNSEAT